MVDQVHWLTRRRRDLLLEGFGKSGSIINECRGRLSLSEIDVRRGVMVLVILILSRRFQRVVLLEKTKLIRDGLLL